MKESTFYYLMQELKIESECSDNKGEEYPSAFADKYNTYYQIAHSYVTGLVPAVGKYARKKCAEARIDFEQHLFDISGVYQKIPFIFVHFHL